MSVQHYPGRRDDPSFRRFGTFSYLPPLTREQMLKQVEYALARDWTCSVEHVEPERSMDTYWYMWKLPFFGERDLNNVVAELEACRRAYPDHHIRLLGYDNYTQSQGSSFVVYEGRS